MINWDEISFKLRSNVFLERICDEYALFAIREASDYCKHMQTINETAAYFWEKLEQSTNVTKLIQEASVDFEVDESIIRSDLFGLLEMMHSAGYIVIEENEISQAEKE